MHPLQVTALALLVFGVAIYVWRGVKRGLRADDEFFAFLLKELSQLLEPRGFRLTRHEHLPKSFGHRMATFEGAAGVLDLVWDGKERDIRLLRRGQHEASLSAGNELAGKCLGFAPTKADYARAASAIIDATKSAIGAA